MTLTECSWGATRKKEGYLKRKYYAIAARRGKKKAAFAVGHKILIAVFFILKNKEPYKEPIQQDLSQKRKEKLIKNYTAKLKELGAL